MVERSLQDACWLTGISEGIKIFLRVTSIAGTTHAQVNCTSCAVSFLSQWWVLINVPYYPVCLCENTEAHSFAQDHSAKLHCGHCMWTAGHPSLHRGIVQGHALMPFFSSAGLLETFSNLIWSDPPFCFSLWACLSGNHGHRFQNRAVLPSSFTWGYCYRNASLLCHGKRRESQGNDSVKNHRCSWLLRILRQEIELFCVSTRLMCSCYFESK